MSEYKTRKTQKWYAVKIGRTPGIYTKWSECCRETRGFPCAQFRSFSTRVEAETWLDPTPSIPNQVGLDHLKDGDETKINLNPLRVYTDGSAQHGKSGGACFVEADGIYYLSNVVFYGQNPGKATNNRGELYGVWLALTHLNPDVALHILVDSTYVQHSLDGGYQGLANRDMIQDIQNLIKTRSHPVTFEHVRAHTGIYGNEQADHFASAASHPDHPPFPHVSHLTPDPLDPLCLAKARLC